MPSSVSMSPSDGLAQPTSTKSDDSPYTTALADIADLTASQEHHESEADAKEVASSMWSMTASMSCRRFLGIAFAAAVPQAILVLAGHRLGIL